MAKKIKFGGIEFRKNTGHDEKFNIKYRSLTTDLNDGFELEIKTLNKTCNIGQSDKRVRVIITLYNAEGQDMGQMYLAQDQRPETYIDIVREMKANPNKLKNA